jgi:polyisoprenoid-binding protein YceI
LSKQFKRLRFFDYVFMYAIMKFYRKKEIFTYVLMLISTVIFSQNEEKSFLKFKIKNAGLTVDGYFSDYKADIQFDESNISKSKFYGEIKTASINTGISMRDDHLRKKEYFNVDKFPIMTFKSTTVSAVSTQKIKIIGDLTIKGITQKIILDVDVLKIRNKTKFSTHYKLNRRDFNIGGKSWTLADELNIFIQLFQ